MIVFPNAKINLGLFVTSKRNDGYHNLETIFVPVKGFCDVLEVLTARDATADVFNNSGLKIDGLPQNNLCLKALALMREFAHIPPLNIHLHKVIPFGAGLGGGSADAAFMLTLLNEQYNLGFSLEELESMAAQLGADCAVFIRNKTVLAKGIGNEFFSTHLNLADYFIQIVIPPLHIPTALAYKNVTPQEPLVSLEKLVQEPVELWKNSVKNDFEPSVFKQYPEIETIKMKLYNEGALYTSMSGSGSSVFGIFKQQPDISWPDDFVIYSGNL